MLLPGAISYPIESEAGASLAFPFGKVCMATTDGAGIVPIVTSNPTGPMAGVT